MQEITPLLLLGALWGVLVVFGGYWLKRISSTLDDLIVRREECLTAFADRGRNAEDHKEFYRRTDEHERRLIMLECGDGKTGGEKPRGRE